MSTYGDICAQCTSVSKWQQYTSEHSSINAIIVALHFIVQILVLKPDLLSITHSTFHKNNNLDTLSQQPVLYHPVIPFASNELLYLKQDSVYRLHNNTTCHSLSSSSTTINNVQTGDSKNKNINKHTSKMFLRYNTSNY